VKAARIAKTVEGGRGYPGSKAGAGVAERIISQMPPHDLYVEPFGGAAQVFRKKLPAQASIVIDSDAAVIDALRKLDRPDTSFRHIDGVRWLDEFAWQRGEKGGTRFGPDTRTVIYCDPPYLQSTLKNPKRRYFRQLIDHGALLDVLERLTQLRVPVLLSGYRSELYDRRLHDWRRIDYRARTRGATVTESLWCNFDPPWVLHDYRFLGGNFRERERIKRKKARWRLKLEKMPALERAALVDALISLSAGPPVWTRVGDIPSPEVTSGSAPATSPEVAMGPAEWPPKPSRARAKELWKKVAAHSIKAAGIDH
jgi:DNA adenine methylase